MTTICDDLRKAVLQAAIQGKLTQQLPEDGNAEDLYREIQAEKQKLIKEGKIKKENPLPAIADDDIPFDIPENWKWVCLGEIVTKPIKRGKSPHYADISNTLVFAQKCNTKAGYIDAGLAQYLDESYLKNYPASEFMNDFDVVINSTGGGTLGRVGIYRDSGNPQKLPIVPDSHVTVIRSMNSTIQQYLYQVLKFMQPELETMGSGSTNQTELRPDIIKALYIPLPPLSEQKRIVARVDELMKRIDEMEKTEKDITALYDAFPGDMKAALLQAAIQGKLTEQLASDGDAETLYADIQKEKQRLIKEGKIKKEKPLPEITEDDIPFDIPEKWKWVYLNDIVVKQIKRGKSPHYANMSNTLVFAQKCNTKAGFIDTGLAQYLDETYLENYPASEFMKDFDVVINSTGGGTLGRVGIYRDSDNPRKLPIVPDSHVTVLRSMDSTIQQYLYHVMKFMQPELEMMGSGSTNQTELRPDTVKALCIPLPPLAEQKRIVEKLDKLLPLCDAMNAEIAGGESA